MISLKRYQQRDSISMSESSISDSQFPSTSDSMTSTSSVSPINESLGFFENQGFSMQNSDGTWSDDSRISSPDILSPIPPPRRSTRTTVKQTKQTSLDSFFLNSSDLEEDQFSAPTRKRKAAPSDENDDFFPEITQEPSQPPSKRITLAPKAMAQRKPRAAAKPKASTGPKSTQNYTLDKPEPSGEPLIWSPTRQGLCETLPYYRAYQSGAYQHDGLIHGFMMDKEVGPHDVFSSKVYISRVGGGKTEDADGNRVNQKDQIASSTVRAFIKTMEQKTAVALIAGFQNSISPCKLYKRYSVLDWAHVTDVFCTKINGFMVWMVRLEMIDLTSVSWWTPTSSLSGDASDLPIVPVNSQICGACNKSSKEIYNQGWTCMHIGCPEYFTFSANGYDEASLGYCQAFLDERTPFTGLPPPSLVPQMMTDEDLIANNAYGIEPECKKGLVCPKCRCCSRRREWLQWTCENSNCDFTCQLTSRPIHIEEVLRRDTERGVKVKEFRAPSIAVTKPTLGLYTVYTYLIPDANGNIIGFIRHFKANSVINSKKDGANEVFMRLQEIDIGLKRNANMHAGLPGEILTNHFSVDTGAPYKYKVAQAAHSFKDADPVILKALGRLTWAGQESVGAEFEEFHEFNEILTLSYFEKMKIDYHDDGEDTLGPTIGTWSLGCNAIMKIRPKAKSPVGGVMKGEGKRHKSDVLVMNLEHGDIVVMHGCKIQEDYEHAVTPQGSVRFAMTSRYIDPGRLTPAARRIAFANSQLPDDFEDKYAYHGDVAPKFVKPTAGQLHAKAFKELYNTAKATKNILTPVQKQKFRTLLEAGMTNA
ncbi:hypothetical protein SBOR_4465 [Sclerotinia borealis F-4128]|uniref:Alpha-ketoglutarate-dependent dioxygenase AlkB-like domain-containing protein n=1 Tax=Sclerotinia borealis (strain F-4128) TaxID=1432307 RepID=W9CKW7_SCLBF|nr:hypothetical protein SBOR_4465 [Sclerotinia borealis F-4128]